MEAAPTKEAPKKGCPEKRLATARAFPVRQPCSKEEVSDKGESENKSRNEKQDPHFYHRNDEEGKHDHPESAIKTPSICVLRIHPGDIALF
jgi:hypothetical protein